MANRSHLSKAKEICRVTAEELFNEFSDPLNRGAKFIWPNSYIHISSKHAAISCRMMKLNIKEDILIQLGEDAAIVFVLQNLDIK